MATRSRTTTENRTRAAKIVKRRFRPGMARKLASGNGLISSLGTLRSTEDALATYLQWCDDNAVPPGERSGRSTLLAYLEEIACDLSQATVNSYRRALGETYRCELPQIKSSRERGGRFRRYLRSEVAKILEHTNELQSISVLLGFYAGVRAHEIATLRPRSEGAPSMHRKWDPLRFTALPFATTRYLVTGKGGLCREVAVPRFLSDAIEQQRRPHPAPVRDRRILYDAWYDLALGQNLSQAFSTISKRVLGWSLGYHGLRHSYAVWRFQALLGAGFDKRTAANLVSQELGHFRIDITAAYLGDLTLY